MISTVTLKIPDWLLYTFPIWWGLGSFIAGYGRGAWRSFERNRKVKASHRRMAARAEKRLRTPVGGAILMAQGAGKNTFPEAMSGPEDCYEPDREETAVSPSIGNLDLFDDEQKGTAEGAYEDRLIAERRQSRECLHTSPMFEEARKVIVWVGRCPICQRSFNPRIQDASPHNVRCGGGNEVEPHAEAVVQWYGYDCEIPDLEPRPVPGLAPCMTLQELRDKTGYHGSLTRVMVRVTNSNGATGVWVRDVGFSNTLQAVVIETALDVELVDKEAWHG